MGTDRAEEYLRLAEDAERKAEAAEHGSHKDGFLEVAKGWRQMAAAVEKRRTGKR